MKHIQTLSRSNQRTHENILYDYWSDIENTFEQLEGTAPSIQDFYSSTKWKYCQAQHRKDRKKIGYLCTFGYTQNNTPFVKIIVNHFKLGKATFNSLVLDKEKTQPTRPFVQLPEEIKKAIKQDQLERLKKQENQDCLDEKKREAQLTEKLSLWKKASHDIQKHAYAIKKKLINNGLMRQSGNELLYPLTSIETGKICGIQTINAKGEKRFFGHQKNTYSLFGNLETASFVYLCEGYATANAVLHLANQHTPFAVINTLNCHNLIPIAQWIKRQYAGKKIMIAADNDQSTFEKGYGNVGLWHASKAAMLTQGTLIYPTNTIDKIVNIDWCDVFVDSPFEEALKAFHSCKKPTFKELALNRLSYASKKISQTELFSAVRDVFQVFLSDFPLKRNEESMIELAKMALARFHVPEKSIKSIWVSVKKQVFAKAMRAKTFSLNPKDNAYTVQSFDSMEVMTDFIESMKAEHPKAIFITNAAMGTGKTQKLMKPQFQQLAEKGEYPVIITPTRALTKGIAKTFETAHYQNDKNCLFNKKGLAITINSIIQEPFEPFLQKTNAVFIDEYTQVLRSITSGTVKPCFRQPTHTKLTDLIQQSTYVFIADADLNQIALNDLIKSAQEDTPVFVMTLQKEANTTPYNIYPCSRHQGKIMMIQRLQETLQKKETCYVLTDSKKRLSVLQEYLKEEEIAHLVVSSDTLKTAQTQDFLKAPDAFLSHLKPQIVLVSPAVQSGLSIESDYFKRVLGIYTGTVEPSVFNQMINRVRKPIVRDILLIDNFGKTFGNENTDTLLSESYRQYMHQFGERHTYLDSKTGMTHIGCLSLKQTAEGLLIQGDPFFERFERLSASLKALEHQQKNNAQGFFALQLLSQGIHFETPLQVVDPKIKTQLALQEKMSENSALEERYNTLCGKNELTTSMYRETQAKEVNSTEEIHAMKRFEIADTLSIEEVRPSDVDFFDNDGKKVLENYQDLINGVDMAQKKDEIEQQQAISKQDLNLHASKVKLLTLIFETLGINKKTGEGSYYHDKAQTLRNIIRKDAALSRYVLLKLSLSINSNLSDLAFINKILKKLLGLKAERLMVRDGHRRTWFYNVRQTMWLLLKYVNNEAIFDDNNSICHQK